MALDAKQIANEIAANVHAAVAAAPEATTPAGAERALPVGADFCAIWPKAKPVLDLLAGVAILIPGAGTTAGAVLQSLIKVGDQISTEVCK
jgi:hypothetical protein